MKKLAPRAHWEPVKVDNGADRYCMKEDTRVDGPWEFGSKPVRRNAATDWEEVKTLAQKGEIDKIDPQVYVSHYRNL